MANAKPGYRINWNEVIVLSVILVVLAALWSTVLVYPLKLLVSFFHDISQVMIAGLTGGAVARQAAQATQGRMFTTSGGIRFLILPAGYIGCIVWGGLLLLAAARTHADKALTGMLGGFVLAAALLRANWGSEILLAIIVAIVLVAAGVKLRERTNDYLLRVIGLSSCLYAFLDILATFVSERKASQDVVEFARHFRIEGLTVVIAGAWMVVAIVATVFFLVLVCRERELRG